MLEKIFNFYKKLTSPKALYSFKLFMIRFVIFGISGYIIEVVITGTTHLISTIQSVGLAEAWRHLGASTHANTGTMAFFVYCWSAIPLTFLTPPLDNLTKNWNRFLGSFFRGNVFALIFMGIEFITGWIALFPLHASRVDMWDYSNIPLNIMGIITFAFYPGWVLGGIGGEWLNSRLEQIETLMSKRDRDLGTYEDSLKGYASKRQLIEKRKTL